MRSCLRDIPRNVMVELVGQGHGQPGQVQGEQAVGAFQVKVKEEIWDGLYMMEQRYLRLIEIIKNTFSCLNKSVIQTYIINKYFLYAKPFPSLAH